MSRRGTRYWYNPETKQVEECGSAPEPSARTELMTGSMYEGVVATDGTVLNSRWKYNEYMRQNGLTHSSDFKEHWQKKRAERERMATGDFDHAARKEAIGRAMYEVFEKGKRR